MGALKEVFVPDIGDFEGVDVIEVLVKPGDQVTAEQSLDGGRDIGHALGSGALGGSPGGRDPRH